MTNGTGTLEEFPPELRDQVSAALEAERQSVDKGIDAWKKIVAGAPTSWLPRRELARVYKKAERWKACVETMKEGVEKASWDDPTAKVDVLFEMVDIYRDRLKLDVMVVNAFNQILTIQPDNLLAVDALSAQYQGMGRWPELISLLRKKASVVEATDEKIALHLKVANLYLEKFSNQAEAIKSFEAILELDAGNPEALGYLKQMYEKRRDWDKLVAVHRQEAERIADAGERGRRWAEVARLATEKLKKPAVSIELWQKVLSAKDDDVEALGELEKLYEREKLWAELAAVVEKQAAQTGDTAKQGALLGKLALLYTEKLQDVGKAIGAWRGLLKIEPDNRRAQDALRKLYLQHKDWDSLEEFYAGQGKWDEFVRVLERQAETEEESARVGLWNKIAQLYRDRLNKADKAQKAFEKTLALDPGNLAASEALVPMYEKGKDARRLANVLQVQLLHTKEPTERQERMLRIVDLYDAQVSDKVAAAEVALQAFAEDPTQEWARQSAERLAAETGNWGPLAQAYEIALPNAAKAEQLHLLSTLARAYERELANPEAAIERNRQILKLDANAEGAVLALERLYVATEQHGELLAIYDKKLALAKTDAEKRDVRLKLAGLYEEEIKDAAKAIELYRDIANSDPSDAQAWRALDRLYVSTAQWQELANTIDRELGLSTEDAATAELKFRLGQVLEQHLDDASGAVSAYRDALGLDPGHDRARVALEAYLGDKKRQMAAVGALEPIYEANQDLARLVEVQRIKLGKEKSTEKRVALFLRIGALEAALGRMDEAYTAYAEAFKEDPASQSARTALEDLAGLLDKWDALVALYTEAQANRKLEPALERELLLVVAVAYDEKLQQSEKAVEYFRLAQEIQPEDASALVALERLYTRTERWPDLVDTLKKKAELVTDAADREQIHMRIAAIWEEMIGNADEAIAAWKEVLGDNPASVSALRALDRLFAQKGLDSELADNLQRQLELTADEGETIGLLLRLAQLRELRLRDLGAAVETYRRLLEIHPAHTETVAALERILPNPQHELALAELLDPVYRSRSDFASLVTVLEIQAKHALDPARKIALLHEVATAYEDGLDSPEQAYDALSRALGESPLDEETQRRIERLARGLGKYDDLIARYQALVGSVPSEDLKNALQHKIATLAENELGRDDIAAQAYLAALETSPRDLEAANALERIYIRNSDYQQLVTLLSRKIEIVEDVAEKKELGRKAAQVWEEVLENPEKAIEVWKQLAVVDETDRDVLDSLERLYVRLGRWNELKDVYAKKADLATDPLDKKNMLFVLGQVYDQELGNPERAIETYTAILDIDPEDFQAVQALDRLYAQTERWYDLLTVLERQTELSGNSAEVVSLKFRVGELWREKLKDFTRAADAYRQVLSMDPTHEPTLRALESMIERNEEPVLAAEVLQPIYETASEWDRVVAVYEVMVGHSEEAAKKTDLLCKIAAIHERRLNDFDKAFEAYGRALAGDPTNAEVIAHLDRLAEVTGRWGDMAATLERELEKVLDSRLQTELQMRIARIYEEETREADKAIAAYKKVVEVEPDRREGLLALDRLYTQTQSWEQLADVLRREARLADSEEQIIELNFRLAQIQELALGDLGKAVEAYQDILNANPAHEETRAALERLLLSGQMQHEIAQVLEPLYRLGEEWDKLIEIYQLELQRLTDTDERQNLLRRLADIAENKLFDQVAAFEWWAKAVLEAPQSEQALDESLRLARITHQWEPYVATMLDAGTQAQDPNVRRDVLLRLAAVFETEVSDLARAEEVLTQVLQEHPQDPAALAFVDRIYDKQGNFEQLADILRRRIAVTDETRELVALQLRLGKILADVLDDPQGATAAYLAVLEHETRSVDALDALEKLYFRAEKWQELYGIYEKMIDVAVGDEQLSDCYARMAKIASDVFGNRERAIELWQRVQDLRGADPMALNALADLHEQAEEWRELTDVLDNQIRATAEPEARIPVYKRLGRIWGEKLGRERNALECWQAVLEVDPSDVEALRAIAENYRSAGAWEELSDTLQRLIDIGPAVLSEDELKDLYSQLGELEGTTLMRTQAAIDAWRQVLHIDSSDFRALAALETLFTQEGRWEECVEVLERRAAALSTTDEQVDVLMQIASIWGEKIVDGGAAAEVYERVLAIDPSNQVASVELENLYRQRKSWMKLVDLLFARIEFVPEPADRIKLFTDMAEIYEQQLNDRNAAFEVLKAAFREDYSNDHVARELERLATEAGGAKWNELIGEYTQIVQAMQDPKQAADLWVKIAVWYDSALQHVEYAIAAAQQALQLDSAHVDALSALETFLRKQARWRELVAYQARHAEVESEPEKKVEILLSLADTYETQLGDVAQATAAYEQALVHDERSLQSIDALERLYRRMNAWDRLVDVLSKKSHIVDDGELAVRLRLQVGELWETRLGDNGRAVDAYKEVLTVDPQNLHALKALERLYQETGQMEAYLDIIEHQLEVTGEDDQRVTLYDRMAKVWEEQFGKPDRAIDCLQKVLLIDDRNQAAYRDLERLYRAEKNWDALVENYRRHILVASDPGERTQLYYQMGEVYEEQLRDSDRAIEAYSDVMSFDPDHTDALRGLSRLYEQTEQWERAVEVLQRLIDTVDRGEKVEINYRLGKIFDEQMRVPETAEERLTEALAIDPTHVPSMIALLTLYKRRGDSLKAAQLMVRAEANTQNALEKTRLLYEAGKIYQNELGDDDRAKELFARTLALDPEHVEAAEPLAELYFRSQEWAPLVPVLEMLARKGDKKANKQQNTLYYRLAKAADQLGDADKALRYYKQAYDLDSTHLPTLLDRANLLYRRQAWDEAFKLYQTVLVHHRESQKDSDIVEIFHRIGQIKLKVGERPKAINMFEKALEIQPGHRPTLEALTEIYSAAGDWEAVIRQKRALLANTQDPDEKLKVHEQIIAVYKDKIKNPQKAIAAYLEALELRPGAHHLLHDVLDLFTETKQWKKAVEILMRLAGTEKGRLRAKYLEAAGNITNYELHATDEAVELYNQALDEDPDNLKTFERIDKILTAKKDWKNQERAYRRMIKRLGTEVPAEKKQTQIALWHALGEIYRSRLKDFKAATQAFEVCIGLDPESMGRHQILAELYIAQGAEGYEKALREYRFIVKRTSDFGQIAGIVRNQRKLYMELGQYDRAWCASSVLAFLRQADQEEARFFEQYRQKGLARAKARLTEDLWQKNVYHPEEDRYVSTILATVSQPLAAIRAMEHKDLGIKRKDRRDPTTDQLMFSRVFSYVGQVLGTNLPELYLRQDWPGELEMINARDKLVLVPSFVVGANLLQGKQERELAYVVGKKLALMRPDHMVRWANVVPTVSELKVAFLAALRLVQPNVPVKPELEPSVKEYHARLARLVQPQIVEQLAELVKRFMASKAEADLHKWSNAVDYTSSRAGYLMCADLETAARMIQTEPVMVGSVDPKEKIKDLIQWTISDEYFTLREHLGLTIG